MDEITLTKKIAKHGKQSIIVIPKILEDLFKPNNLVEIKLRLVKKSEA